VIKVLNFVISASSGEEALQILEKNNIDLIISDVMMEEMDGFELCGKIKSNINVSHAPVILLTTNTAESKIKGTIGMPPNDFIKVTRLKKACKMMVEGEYRVTEIGFLVGFSSSSYFAKCFQKQFGMLPTEFLKKIKEAPSSATK
jgi:YesN/AraC family two-component response regulator